MAGEGSGRWDRRRKPGPAGVGQGVGPSPGAGGSGGDDARLREALDRVDAMIAAGKRLGFNLAAENLRHWRDGTGGDLVVPASAFRAEPFLMEHLRLRHRPRFVAGARRRFLSRELTPGGEVAMDWTDSVNAPYMTDLFFALGGFTVHSHVVVTVDAGPGPRYTLRFKSWVADVSDRYDWDAGKWTLIPGLGRVTDDEMLALERAGKGRAYSITSEPAQINDPEVTAGDTVP